jgi:hypothetical protein
VLAELTFRSNELDQSGVIKVRAIARLLVPFGYESDYTYMSSQTVAANWARGAIATYQISNDAGTLVNHPLSGGKLFVLKEPDSPTKSNPEITVELGCQLAFFDYLTSDRDFSGVTLGTPKARDEIIAAYLDAAGITHSLTSIPYPFEVPVPSAGGYVETAGKLAYDAGHFLRCRADGTVVNQEIVFSGTAIATFTVGTDDVNLEPRPAGSQEFPPGQLIVSGITREIDAVNYPDVSVMTDTATVRYFGIGTSGNVITKAAQYTSKEVTTTDSGWNGSYEQVEQLTKTGYLVLGVPPIPYLLPTNRTNTLTYYESKRRLSSVVVEGFTRTVTIGDPPVVGSEFRTSLTITTYTYSDADIITAVETVTYEFMNSGTGDNQKVSSATRSLEVWVKESAGLWSHTKQYYDKIITAGQEPTLTASNLQEWISATSPESTSERSRNAQPPATTYRVDAELKEREIRATVVVEALAGSAYQKKPEPYRADYLTTYDQAYDWGLRQATIIFGRARGKQILVGWSTTLLADIKPFARIDIVNGAILERYVVDAIASSDVLDESSLGLTLILISTSPMATPSTVIKPLVAIISGTVTANAGAATVTAEGEVDSGNVLTAIAGAATVSAAGWTTATGDLLAIAGRSRVNATGTVS